MNPPGRFLKQDPVSKLWSTVDKKKAIDKTRQALREGAPELLKSLAGSNSDVSTSKNTSVSEHIADHTRPLNFNGSTSFPFTQGECRPHNHLRFLSDISTDMTQGLGMFNMADPMDTSRLLETPEDASRQVLAGGTALNKQGYSGADLSAMLRTAQMEMIQRHIMEWQQICNMRAAMQTTGYGDSQLQLQGLQIQMQLQNAWNEAFQQNNNASDQQQHFAANNPHSFSDNAISRLLGTNEPSPLQTAPATNSPYVQQETTNGNVPDFASLLAVLQNNSTSSINTSNSNVSQSATGKVQAPNATAQAPQMYQQLAQQLQSQMSAQSDHQGTYNRNAVAKSA
jgi:hypothetical protein